MCSLIGRPECNPLAPTLQVDRPARQGIRQADTSQRDITRA